ncbi:Hydroxyproline-rich glycoprotein family protein [Heracleum sosnowskyi]|uniref:Hydroxyproline-rich glycoprotein family protein n=1 Tax=Heracleum sosnowskyi TaxID=360622 RepID=A0AAD8IYL1_9APIA|nr:Hydroxyproline-rich glycoprotein family protein [Heracleum sosnowskyi]
MSNLSNNSFQTVNAAATAIVNAQTRVQPSSARKRRWGGCWSLYWCFGSPKHSKRIGHATLVPEPTEAATAAPFTETINNSSTIVFPFVAPPSSPASFFQSEPPSDIHSPAKLLSLASLSVNAYSPGGTPSIFTIGPYAYETQLVSPPVFSTYTTEPSTASFTPPPESAQLTTPSSPEVPFAQLLASSLARTQRNTGPNQKFSSSQYDFQPYWLYPGSPGGYIISPGSTIPNSGTSSPFPATQPIIKFHVEEIPNFLGYEYFSSQKWGSRLGSGTLTPSGLVSRLGSGASTPNGLGLTLGSGALTPTNDEPVIKVTPVESQISEMETLASSDKISEDEEVFFDHRVSFELPTEYVPACLEKDCSLEMVPECPEKVTTEGGTLSNNISEKANKCCDCEGCSKPVLPEKTKRDKQEQQCQRVHQTHSLGSSKEFIFDNTKGDVSRKPTLGVEWWTSDKGLGKKLVPRTSWTFFPMLQPEAS